MSNNEDYITGKKFQTLKPWVKGNNSVTPAHFYRDYKIVFNNTIFIALDIKIPLYKANTVDTSNISSVRLKNTQYIKKALEMLDIDVDDTDCPLTDRQRKDVLDVCGEPPTSSYNLYFITIQKNDYEELVYIGKTDSKESRFKNGHLAALKLHDPKYSQYEKYVYFGTITFMTDLGEYLPLECICDTDWSAKLLDDLERVLITKLNPVLNTKHDDSRIIEKEKYVITIENMTGSDFLNMSIDYTF